MRIPFEDIAELVLDHEGGLSMDPNDPGNYTDGAVGHGELKGTKFGISAASFPNLDIANLTIAQAKEIYQTRYWDPIHGDELPSPVALLVFDAAVNSGVSSAGKMLQEAVGVTVDGTIGPITLTAAHGYPGGDLDLCRSFTTRRLMAYIADRNFEIYGEGWCNRVASMTLRAGAVVAATEAFAALRQRGR